MNFSILIIIYILLFGKLKQNRLGNKRVTQDLLTVAHDLVTKTNIIKQQPDTQVKEIVSKNVYVTGFLMPKSLFSAQKP